MEDRETRLKRLRLRSWRRGIKEMDLIFGNFADVHLADLTPAQLDAHEALMSEADQDLYQWVSGQMDIPAEFQDAVALVQSKIWMGS
ncbi:MAG: succinate dehydrogenase assembly factor 2 [Pseudomonadota bacterium]